MRTPHGTSGAGNDFLRGIDIVGVQVGELDLGNFRELSVGQRADSLQLGDAGAALNAELLLDEHGRGRGLAHKGEGLVLVNRNLNRDDGAGLILRLSVERLAELHDVDALRTKSRAYRRSRVGSASRNLQLDEAGLLLSAICTTFQMNRLLDYSLSQSIYTVRSPGPRWAPTHTLVHST